MENHQRIAGTDFAGGITVMELLDRYLQAVRFWLPRAQQDDIIAELGEDIRSQIEDKESALGRPLHEDELVTLLHQTGHPIRVAGRYQPQQSLIGPTLFPLYEFVLKIVALGYLGPWVLVWSAMLFFMPAYRAEQTGLPLLGTWAHFWSLAITLFGAITIVFAVLERCQAKIGNLYKWDPRKLPRVVERKQRVSRVESIFGLVFSAFFVAWWLSLPRFGHLMFGAGDGSISLNPALHAYFLPVLVPTLVIMAQQCINIFRPDWTWLRPTMLMVSDAITLGILQSLVNRYPYVILTGSARDAARYARAEFALNQVIQWSLIVGVVAVSVALVVHTFQTIQALRRMGKQPRNNASVQISQVL
jgi:hypothetical protein